jgi:hypothetical protein
MCSLIGAVFSVAALLSATSGAFAQGAQPGPTPGPGLTVPAPKVSPGPTPGVAPRPTFAPTPDAAPTPPTANPGPTVSPAPSSQSSTEETARAWPEPGRYHPCPASVSFGNGRSVCLGLDEPRRHGYRHHYGHYYGYAVPVFEYSGNAYYGFPAPSYIHTPWPIYAAEPIHRRR